MGKGRQGGGGRGKSQAGGGKVESDDMCTFCVALSSPCGSCAMAVKAGSTRASNTVTADDSSTGPGTYHRTWRSEWEHDA